MPDSEGRQVVITQCRAGAFYVSSVLCTKLWSRACGWCLPAPGTKVNASVTLLPPPCDSRDTDVQQGSAQDPL